MHTFNFLALLGTVAAEIWHDVAAKSWYHAAEANCLQGVDVMFLQDTTDNFGDDFRYISSKAAEITGAIDKLFPNSRYGVAQFKDKPFIPLGDSEDDFCYRLTTPLGSGSVLLRDGYEGLTSVGGGDLADDSYQALINVAYDANVHWRPLVNSSQLDPTKSAARYIVLITNAMPHKAGDVYEYKDWVNLLPKNPGSIMQNRFDEFCASYDYPHHNQMEDAMYRTQTAVIFLIKPDRREKRLLPEWQWVNRELLRQPDWFLHELSDNSQNIVSAIVEIMQKISQLATCKTTTESTTKPTTTTEKPTTTTEATTTTTTSTTTTPSMTTTTQLMSTTQKSTPTTTTTLPTTATQTTTPAIADECDSAADGCVAGVGCCNMMVKNQLIVNVPKGNDHIEINLLSK